MTTLYVGDLAPNVTDPMLVAHFHRHSVTSVRDTHVCRDRETRRSLGYAYVNFENQPDAEKAMSIMNFTVIEGTQVPIRIMWSRRDPSVRNSGRGNIVVKNLAGAVTSSSLFTEFKQFGTILSCKVATDEKGQSKGIGFVHYEQPEAAQKAIATMNGKVMEGREIEVMPFKRNAEQQFTNLYVKFLDLSVDNDKLKQLFSQYGEVTTVFVAKNPKEESKGVAYVGFKDHEQAAIAIANLHGKHIPGISVGEGLYVQRHKEKHERKAELKQLHEAKQAEQPAAAPGKGGNLYIKNLSDGVTNEMLCQLFSQFGPCSASVMKDANGASRGFGFVKFMNPEDSKNALDLHSRLFHGKPLYVAYHQRKEQRRQALEQRYGRGFPMQMYPSIGLYPQLGYFNPLQQMPRVPLYPPMIPPTWMPQQQMARQQQGARPQPAIYSSAPGSSYTGVPKPRGGPMTQPQAQQVAQAQQPGQRRPASKPPPDSWATRAAKPPQDHVPTRYIPASPPQVDVEDEKQQVGEQLYNVVHGYIGPEYSGKITGMLLESLGIAPIRQLLNSDSSALETKILEANKVLQEHLRSVGQGTSN